MAKKRRMPVLAGQILFMLLGLLMVFIWAGILQQSLSSIYYHGTMPGVFLILGFVFFGVSILLESVAFEKVADENSNPAKIPYLPPPPASLHLCPTCKKSLTFIKEYDAWFCFNCKEYK